MGTFSHLTHIHLNLVFRPRKPDCQPRSNMKKRNGTQIKGKIWFQKFDFNRKSLLLSPISSIYTSITFSFRKWGKCLRRKRLCLQHRNVIIGIIKTSAAFWIPFSSLIRSVWQNPCQMCCLLVIFVVPAFRQLTLTNVQYYCVIFSR